MRMGVKVAATCLHWSKPSVPHSPSSSSSSSQTLASTISSPSLKRRSFSDGALALRNIHTVDRSALFGTRIYRSGSCEQLKSRIQSVKASSAGSDSFSDEEFNKKIQELESKFENENLESEISSDSSCGNVVEDFRDLNRNGVYFAENRRMEPSDWPERDEIVPASIEWKASRVDLPHSLRIIKRKKQWEKGFREAKESAYCSIKKAFSSMVFIIRELQSFNLQMRELLFFEDLQGILARVQKDMNASFVWLFQQVFSHTPTLMVYVMILLANYSVHSMAANAAISPPRSHSSAAATESVSVNDDQSLRRHKFDASSSKTFSVSSSSGKTASIGGNNGGGGKFGGVASGTDGDGTGSSSSSDCHRSAVGDSKKSGEEESISGQLSKEEEMRLWNSVVDEASRMEKELRDEALDEETVQRFVSPVTAKIEEDDYRDYLRTELVYQRSLALDPNNSLLLANFAQFLYLVAQDYDRAEEYFKRAAKVKPADAEALSKYASFLWEVRKDLWAAEETYLEAISAEPTNSYYAANYAHFLWNTGGEDTCFPLPDSDTNHS